VGTYRWRHILLPVALGFPSLYFVWRQCAWCTGGNCWQAVLAAMLALFPRYMVICFMFHRAAFWPLASSKRRNTQVFPRRHWPFLSCFRQATVAYGTGRISEPFASFPGNWDVTELDRN
jgi:hypothetical protein